MRWEDERYVRVYTRDTVDWIGMSWEARALYLMLLRKVDRAGIIELGKAGAKGLAAYVHMPAKVVEKFLPELIADGCVEEHGGSLVVPNFIEAQEAKKSDQARQQESRLKRRDQVRAGLDPRARATVVYFLQGEDGGPIKIGRTDDLAKRIVSLETARPDKLVTLGAFPGSVQDEVDVHKRFAHLREKGEWFSATPELLGFIKETVLGHGGTVTPCHTPQAVTNCDQSPDVTVTPSLAEPSRTEPKRDVGQADEPVSVDGAKPAPVQAVWDAYLVGWRRHVGKGAEPKLTDGRRAKIRARLKDHGDELVMAAASGVWRSTWHIENGHTEIDLVMRDAAHVERFAKEPARPTPARPKWQAPVQPLASKGQSPEDWYRDHPQTGDPI